MAHEVKYDGVTTPTFSTFVDTIRQGSAQWTNRAALGDVGMSTFTVEDSDGTAGYSNDAFRGHKTIRVNETSAPVGNQNILTGFVGQRTYKRGTDKGLLTGIAREIEVSVLDINAAAGFEIFHDGDGDRPAETVSERIDWLLGSGYIQAFDLGNVETSTVAMDANNYDGQTPADVLADCALKAGFNWFLDWDPAAEGTALFFLDSNTSTLYSSGVKISNVLADVTGSHVSGGSNSVYAPFWDAELTRDPQHVYSGIYVPYDGGAVYRRNTATGSNFAWRDGPAPTASVKSSAAAIALGDRELEHASSEKDELSVTIQVPASAVNAVRHGHRLQAKFSHLPGYTEYTWWRVLTRTVRQETDSANYYLDLVLSPQCADLGLTQVTELSDGVDADKLYFPFTPTIGSLLIAHVGNRAATYNTTPATDGWTLIVGQSDIGGTGKSQAVWVKDYNGSDTYLRNATTNRWGFLWEIAGGPAASSLTGSGTTGTTAGSGTDTISTPSISVSAAGSLILGFFAVTNDTRAGGAWSTAGSGGATRQYQTVKEVGPELTGVSKSVNAGSQTAAMALTSVSSDYTTYPPVYGAIGLVVEGGSSCG